MNDFDQVLYNLNQKYHLISTMIGGVIFVFFNRVLKYPLWTIFPIAIIWALIETAFYQFKDKYFRN